MGSRKKIGTFKEFMKDQNQKLNETTINLHVDWWDQCKVEVMQDLKDECNGMLTYDTLMQYVKNKFEILGREVSGYGDIMILEHIKDLIYIHHGDSYVTDNMCNFGEDKMDVHSLGLTICELAKVILDEVLSMTKSEYQDSGSTLKLGDTNPTVLVPVEQIPADEDEDEISPFESKICIHPQKQKDKKQKQVLRLKDYSKLCEDFMGHAKFKLVNYDDVLKLTLNTIEKEAGSLKTDDIYEVAKKDKSMEGMNKSSMILEYVSAVGFEQIKQNGEIEITKLKNYHDIPKSLIDIGIGNISNQIAEDAVKMINQKSKTENEEIK